MRDRPGPGGGARQNPKTRLLSWTEWKTQDSEEERFPLCGDAPEGPPPLTEGVTLPSPGLGRLWQGSLCISLEPLLVFQASGSAGGQGEV